jgi:thioredoxin reductase
VADYVAALAILGNGNSLVEAACYLAKASGQGRLCEVVNYEQFRTDGALLKPFRSLKTS